MLGSGHFEQDNSSDNSTDEKLTNRISTQPPDSIDNTDRDHQLPIINQISSALHSHLNITDEQLLNTSTGVLRPSKVIDECSNSSNFYDETRTTSSVPTHGGTTIELVEGTLNGRNDNKLNECRANIVSSPLKPLGHDLSDIIGDVVDLNELPPPPGAPKPENSARLRRYRLNVE